MIDLKWQLFLKIAAMPQLPLIHHWSTWRGELQESPAGFGLAHHTRNAHMVRELPHCAFPTFPGGWIHFMWLVAGSRNHQAMHRVMCARSNWIVNFETSDLWSNHVLISAMSCIPLTSQQFFSLGAMILFLLCNRPAVQVASSGSKIDTSSFLYYTDRFEMRKKIDEKNENRCFFPKNA